MNTLFRALVITLALVVFIPLADAQTPQQSGAPADLALKQKISKALEDAGISFRTTSVQIVTTSDHVVYLKGLISDKDTIALAGKVAAQNAPGYRVVNNIKSSFFDDPNHVTGDKDK